ncbi:Peptidyl-prolyl cis-trans isomerase cyp8, partial [Nowakowskiella sp. JEL0078]
TDKLYITNSEWANEFGGAKKKQLGTAYKRLPFNFCALSLQPAENPYCAPDGIVYDLVNVLPFLKKYGINPSTGEKMTAGDLFKLNFHLANQNPDSKSIENSRTLYHCPITFKVFNEHTHIVAVRTSGNVFAYDAVQRLNIKTKCWNDLLTGEPFTKDDIVTIQDPTHLEPRNINSFFFIRNELAIIDDSIVNGGLKGEAGQKLNTRAMGATGDILNQILKKEAEKPKSTVEVAASSIIVVSSSMDTRPAITPSFVDKQPKAYNSAHYSRGLSSASFTSMSLTPQLSNDSALFNEEEYLFEAMRNWNGPEVAKKGKPSLEKSKRGKGYVRIVTNLGNLNVELSCCDAPKTCYNFLKLAKKGYYNGVKFHRSIPGFIIQGGDPTGTGKGGESIWGKNFEDEIKQNVKHAERGTLSMANHGKDTNSSQFFFTFKACPHLDMKHTVFGKIVGGMDTLDKMEAIKCSNERPIKSIVIEEISVFVEPFDQLKEQLAKKLQQDHERTQEEIIKKQKNEERIQNILQKDKDRKRKQLAGEIVPDETTNSKCIGKYLKRDITGNVVPEKPLVVDEALFGLALPKDLDSEKDKKKKGSGGYSDFGK